MARVDAASIPPTLGSRIVDRLVQLVPPESVGVSVRDVAKASSLAARGVRVRHGDFTAPDTLEHAFEGADRVLVISAAIRGSGAVDANCAAIDAAREAGASGIFYTSHQAASTESLFAPAVAHAHNEAQTAHADLAEVAATALAEDRMHPGVTPPLTAGETFDLSQLAERLSKLARQPVERIVVDDDEWKASATEGGLPPQAVEFMFGQYLAARNGEFAVVDPTLEQIIARPAIPVDDALDSLADPAGRP